MLTYSIIDILIVFDCFFVDGFGVRLVRSDQLFLRRENVLGSGRFIVQL